MPLSNRKVAEQAEWHGPLGQDKYPVPKLVFQAVFPPIVSEYPYLLSVRGGLDGEI